MKSWAVEFFTDSQQKRLKKLDKDYETYLNLKFKLEDVLWEDAAVRKSRQYFIDGFRQTLSEIDEERTQIYLTRKA